MTIVEAARGITGGVDTHRDVHVAAALDPLGGLLGSESFATDSAGYKALLKWLESFGEVTKIGVEGTGSYGSGLSRYLRRVGVTVIEVDRPNREERRRSGKSDPLDAVEAARAALSGRASGHPKSRDGAVEAIRVLVVAKRSARQARVKALTQMRHLGYSAPEQLRCRLKGLSVPALVAEGKGLRPTRSPDPVTAATKASLSSLAHRISSLEKNSPSSTRRSKPSWWPPSPICWTSSVSARHRGRPRHGRRRQPRTPPLRGSLGASVRRRRSWQTGTSVSPSAGNPTRVLGRFSSAPTSNDAAQSGRPYLSRGTGRMPGYVTGGGRRRSTAKSEVRIGGGVRRHPRSLCRPP